MHLIGTKLKVTEDDHLKLVAESKSILDCVFDTTPAIDIKDLKVYMAQIHSK